MNKNSSIKKEIKYEERVNKSNIKWNKMKDILYKDNSNNTNNSDYKQIINKFQNSFKQRNKIGSMINEVKNNACDLKEKIDEFVKQQNLSLIKLKRY